MKRLLCILLTLLMVTPALALAGDGQLYISNPNPSDRLHLREKPDKNARSMGKFYNGTPITQISDSGGDWVKVRVDDTSGGLSMEGWMQYKYLSSTKPANAMPQYVTREAIKDAAAIGRGSSIPAGTPVALMGVNEAEHLWFLRAYLTNGEVSFNVREKHPALLPLPDKGCNVYISNPDAKDRLHLRATPGKTGRDMGKYYNGCVGTLLGFSDDAQWLKVRLYGRTGWMQRKYLYIENQGSNPCMYGIPMVSASGGQLFSGERGTGSAQTLPQNAQVEVLGLVDNTWLHVCYDGKTGYIRRDQTSFTE